MPKSVKRLACLIFAALAALLLTQGCCLVDEDQSDCSVDVSLRYEMRLVTNITTEIDTQLSLLSEAEVNAALKRYMRDVFTDFAHDAQLSFYDAEPKDSLRLEYIDTILNAATAFIEIDIPAHHYDHRAIANLRDNGALIQVGDDRLPTARLQMVRRDTVPSMQTGVFFGHTDISIADNEDQTFKVELHMINCANALVLDTLGSHIRDMKVYTTGFASELSVRDSLYNYAYSPIVVADPVDIGEAGLCYAAVVMPSHQPEDTRTIIEEDDSFVTEGDDSAAFWEYRIYATLADGTVTFTRLSVGTPLKGGQLKVLKARVCDDGSVRTGDSAVSASVELDWQEAGQYEPEL